MKTIKKVTIKPVHVETIPDVMDENVMYISDKYSIMNHLCLCGCGCEVALPIMKNGWHIKSESDDTLTITPSIGSFQLPCKSHYIITKSVANFV